MDDVIIGLLLIVACIGLGFIGLGIFLDRKKKAVSIGKPVNSDDKEYTRHMGIILNEKYIGWSGSTPFVEFDENYVQMPLTRTELKIPREHTTRMSYMAWFSGFIAGSRGLENLKTFMIIILITCLAVGGLVYFLSSGTSADINSLRSSVTTGLGNLTNDLGSLRVSLNLNTTPVV